MEKLGPEPTRMAASAPPMSGRRAAVYDVLRGSGDAATITEIATRMSLHPNTVREHLDALVAAGVATREAAPPQGRGRPAWRYRAAADTARDVRIRDYVGLASALAGHLARTSRTPTSDAERAGEDWGTDLAAGRGSRPGSPAAVRREVVAILDDLGFAPAPDRGLHEVRLRQCPLLDAVARNPGVVCGVHVGLVRGATERLGGDGSATALHPFAEPGACVLHLNGRRPNGTGT